MIEYFFPAKYQTDTNWDEVLNKMIPKFSNPNSEEEYHKAMVELVVSLDDSHALIYPNKDFCNFGCYNVPFEFKIIDSSAVITKFYDTKLSKLDELQIGDVITKVEGQDINQIFTINKKYIHGSNHSRKRINAGYYLLNGSTQSVNVEIIRKGRTFSKTIKRYLFKDFNHNAKNELEKYKILDDNIGYVNVGAVKDVPKAMEALMNTKAIIFDIRKSTAATPYYFASYITSQRRDFYKAIEPDLDYPGKYKWTKTYQSGTSGKLEYTGKVILLVDEYCQSQQEFTAMCLQTGDNVTTVGSQTSGADGNVVKFNMLGGFSTQISGVGIFYPDGTEAQRRGVKIDIVVKPTIQGLVAGKDEILERAVAFINE